MVSRWPGFKVRLCVTWAQSAGRLAATVLPSGPTIRQSATWQGVGAESTAGFALVLAIATCAWIKAAFALTAAGSATVTWIPGARRAARQGSAGTMFGKVASGEGGGRS